MRKKKELGMGWVFRWEDYYHGLKGFAHIQEPNAFCLEWHLVTMPVSDFLPPFRLA